MSLQIKKELLEILSVCPENKSLNGYALLKLLEPEHKAELVQIRQDIEELESGHYIKRVSHADSLMQSSLCITTAGRELLERQKQEEQDRAAERKEWERRFKAMEHALKELSDQVRAYSSQREASDRAAAEEEREKEKRQFSHERKIALLTALAGALFSEPLWNAIFFIGKLFTS